MKIETVKFVRSVWRAEDHPRDGRPEIAFVGRSNVGKSTLLNALLNRKALAKTSTTPGKTQAINYFNVNDKFYFVDLPGYGFAKVPKQLKEQWLRVMTQYLLERAALRLVVALVDARHEVSPKDVDVLHLLEDAERPTLIVATKIDKLSRGRRKQHLDRIRSGLGLDDDALIVPFSGLTREGAREVWRVINTLLFGA
ncbi:MAG TPA: ribosome biogenesis GTP-binding protein YihA/YsxC [Candidatus Hydrogenedentes bacterium]|nr:ribosome biogenesis GTP-binding protein YihA/YsxC [Candidatus Hydrogenedentota bacterium]